MDERLNKQVREICELCGADASRATDGEFLRSLYEHALGRAPDEAGFRHHLGRLRGGHIDRHTLVREFLACEESTQRIPGLSPPDSDGGTHGRGKDERYSALGGDGPRKKTVRLRAPFDGLVLDLEGSARDESIIGGIEKCGGVYEPHIMTLLKAIVRAGDTIVDIGANVGAITLVAAYLAKPGPVYAFEPSRFNFENLEDNVRRNGFQNVIGIRAGVSDRNEETDFSFVESFAGGSFHSETGVAEGVRERVRLVRLDDWVAENDIARIDLIKMDIEGAETKALEGARQVIERLRPKLIIECNVVTMKRFFGVGLKEFHALLSEIYPFLYVIGDAGTNMEHIPDYGFLERKLEHRRLEDLYCSFEPFNAGTRILSEVVREKLRFLGRYLRRSV